MKNIGIIIFSSVISIAYTIFISFVGNILFPDGLIPGKEFIIIAFLGFLSIYFTINAFSSPTEDRTFRFISAICIALVATFLTPTESYYGNKLFTLLVIPYFIGVSYLGVIYLTNKKVWVISFSLVFFPLLFILGLVFAPVKKTNNELLSEIRNLLEN